VRDQRRGEYGEVFDAFIEQLKNDPPDVVAIAGDVFDTMTQASADNWNDVASLLQRAAAIAKAVIIIPGNHDMNVRRNAIGSKGKERPAPDLLSPLLDSAGGARELQRPRVTLWRNAGYYRHPYWPDVLWCVGACDEPLPDPAELTLKLRPADQAVVALFHETVSGSRYPNDQKAETTRLTPEYIRSVADAAHALPVAVLLGDVHLRQAVSCGGAANAAAAYPGSLVCQNFGEPHVGHGWLQWDLSTTPPTYLAKEVPNPRAVYTVQLVDGVEHTRMPRPGKPRAWRVQISGATTPAQAGAHIERLTKLHGFSPRDVVRLAHPAAPPGGLGALPPGGEPGAAAPVTANPLTVNPDEEIVEAAGFIRETVAEARLPSLAGKDEAARGLFAACVLERHRRALQGVSCNALRCEITRLEFSNLYCYGPSNVLDIAAVRAGPPGLVGLVAPNASGKSALLDVLTLAMTGQQVRGKKSSALRAGADFYALSLDFKLEGQSGRVEMWRAGHRQGLTLVHGEENLTQKTVTETTLHLRRLFGTASHLSRVTLFRPGQHPDFAKLDTAHRREILAELLALGHYSGLKAQLDREFTSLKADAKALVLSLSLVLGNETKDAAAMCAAVRAAVAYVKSDALAVGAAARADCLRCAAAAVAAEKLVESRRRMAFSVERARGPGAAASEAPGATHAEGLSAPHICVSEIELEDLVGAARASALCHDRARAKNAGLAALPPRTHDEAAKRDAAAAASAAASKTLSLATAAAAAAGAVMPAAAAAFTETSRLFEAAHARMAAVDLDEGVLEVKASPLGDSAPGDGAHAVCAPEVSASTVSAYDFPAAHAAYLAARTEYSESRKECKKNTPRPPPCDLENPNTDSVEQCHKRLKTLESADSKCNRKSVTAVEAANDARDSAMRNLGAAQAVHAAAVKAGGALTAHVDALAQAGARADRSVKDADYLTRSLPGGAGAVGLKRELQACLAVAEWLLSRKNAAAYAAAKKTRAAARATLHAAFREVQAAKQKATAVFRERRVIFAEKTSAVAVAAAAVGAAVRNHESVVQNTKSVDNRDEALAAGAEEERVCAASWEAALAALLGPRNWLADTLPVLEGELVTRQREKKSADVLLQSLLGRWDAAAAAARLEVAVDNLELTWRTLDEVTVHRMLADPVKGLAPRLVARAEGVWINVVNRRLASSESDFILTANEGDLSVSLSATGRAKGRLPFCPDPALMSGYQSFALELASRAALAELARVPIPSLLMIDEGFGCLDEKNLPAIAEGLRVLANDPPPGRGTPLVLAVTHRKDLRPAFAQEIHLDPPSDGPARLVWPPGARANNRHKNTLEDPAGGGGSCDIEDGKCPACDIRVGATDAAWARHVLTATHAAWTDPALVGDRRAPTVKCATCDVDVASKGWASHVKTVKHTG
jgi:hypothetical protein